ncbi:CotH kinase family protein [Salipaludibacillus agaradhaerens]|uniref:CotH kinase family protein n=1 Tax=Salipaludibacillus agaradhaerens TaxID=76935 RepID=UPI00215091A2|nr:CotH kinase family protein [Salipaludibacillus agaradhaerens]MCR6105064.1 CotH kinase family protein [Salipaludibacillus agaradhaerens]MCR6117109.1 CotH kinase family protein [Salipaludibacillus agaradhaerens]
MRTSYCRLLSILMLGTIVLLIGSLVLLPINFRAYAEESSTITINPVFTADTISDVNIEIDEEEWQDILNNPLDKTYKIASVTYNGETIDNVGFRTKGNSSLTNVANSESERYSFKIDFQQYTDQTLHGYTKINLNNNFSDPSYMREYLHYELLSQMGVPTPDYSYVNLSINGELYGLYLAIENIEEPYLERHFGDTTGNLYKADEGASLEWNDNMTIDDTALDLKSGLANNSQLLSFIESLASKKNSDSYFNVDQFLRYLAVNTVLANMDSYQGRLQHNYYLYELDGTFTFLAWDHNMSFGGFSMGASQDEQLTMLIDEPTQGAVENFPLIDYVLSNEDYKEDYHNYLQDSIDLLENFDEAVMEVTELIDESVQNDPTAFYSYDDFLANTGVEAIDNVPGITGFINERTKNVQQQLDGDIPSYENGEGLSDDMGGAMQGGPPGDLPDDLSEEVRENMPGAPGGDWEAPEGVELPGYTEDREEMPSNMGRPNRETGRSSADNLYEGITVGVLGLALVGVTVFFSRFRRHI